MKRISPKPRQDVPLFSPPHKEEGISRDLAIGALSFVALVGLILVDPPGKGWVRIPITVTPYQGVVETGLPRISRHSPEVHEP